MDTFHVQWHITSKCNLECRHCYQDDFSQKGDLGWDGLKAVCDNMLEFVRRQGRFLTVALTGGEPFLKKELFDIIGYLYSSSYVSDVSIITNGTIVDKYISKILEYPLLSDIYVSLDGITARTNDYIRGQGSFEKAIKNIKLLKSHGLTVFIMFTCLKCNIEETKGLSGLCKELGADGYILERFIPLGYGKQMRHEFVSAEELNSLYSTIFGQCDINYSKEKAAMYHALKVELAENESLYGAECIVAKDGCAVLPDGVVLPCRRFAHPLGNLLTQPLKKIWEDSGVLKRLKDKENLWGSCRSCTIDECSGCRALAYALTGDYCAPDPLCRFSLKQ
jgi:radical SAM protein with 4Fe4S-binding SPASM domain